MIVASRRLKFLSGLFQFSEERIDADVMALLNLAPQFFILRLSLGYPATYMLEYVLLRFILSAAYAVRISLRSIKLLRCMPDCIVYYTPRRYSTAHI